MTTYTTYIINGIEYVKVMGDFLCHDCDLLKQNNIFSDCRLPFRCEGDSVWEELVDIRTLLKEQEENNG